jgi:predicted O-methyltransferase YrrM
MSQSDFEDALRNGRPYFEPYKSCRKSWPHIYWYQQKLIHWMAQRPWPAPPEILEIGSWAGASAVSWGHALNTCFRGKGHILCVDPWESDDVPDIKSIFLHNVRAAGIDALVEPFDGTNHEAFSALKERRFDVIYIDGDHAYPHVSFDIANARRHLRPGGIICGDDLEVQVDEITMADVIDSTDRGDSWALSPKDGNGYHPGVTRAVAEAFGAVSSWFGFWAVQENGESWVRIPLDDMEAGMPPALMEYDDEGRRVG